MKVCQTRRFEKAVKKIPKNQKLELDNAIRDIINNPYIGQEKVGDLAGVRIYKFRMVNQLILIAYTFKDNVLTLLAFGSHENFYRDLKNQ